MPSRLRKGDRVRLVSPASTPAAAEVAARGARLSGLGLEVEIGDHVLDEWGYLAGRDEDRLRDLNDAFADNGVRAVVALAAARAPIGLLTFSTSRRSGETRSSSWASVTSPSATSRS